MDHDGSGRSRSIPLAKRVSGPFKLEDVARITVARIRVFSSMLNMENTEQRGTGIENGSEWSNGSVHFDRTGLTEKGGPPRKVGRFFRNFSGWAEPIHSVLDRNFRKFWLNGSPPTRLVHLIREAGLMRANEEFKRVQTCPFRTRLN